MSKAFNDPSLLTKDRLKRELESNGVKLPRGDQKKEFYVTLYRENLSPDSGRRLGNGDFSSDDDDFDNSPQMKQIVPRASRTIKKVGSKEIAGSDIKSMSDEDLKEELRSLGHPVGPIIPTTRDLYERKLARLRASTRDSDGPTTTITKSEFSDFSAEEEQNEESIPDDEFFYRRRGQNRRSGGTFGSTFTKNFEDSSSQKEVTRDFSVSSSRNVEHSSTVDRKTMNKVLTKKGDKFEQRSWNSGFGGRSNEEENEESELPTLPPQLQKALTAATRYSPQKENGMQVRARPAREKPAKIPENVPGDRGQAAAEEKPKKERKGKGSWRKWWILILILLILLGLAAAVAYNMEGPPAIQKQFRYLAVPTNST